MLRPFATALLMVGMALPAMAQNSAEAGPVLLEDWGTFTASSESDVPAPGSHTGQLGQTNAETPLLRSSVICAGRGTRFGIKIRLRNGLGFDEFDVAIEIDHPAITNSDGQLQTRDDFNTVIEAGRAGWKGWLFEDPKNFKSGTWTWVVRHDGAVYLRKSFDVRFHCDAPVA